MVEKVYPERTRVDINDAIAEVLSLSRQELQRNRVTIRTDLAPTLPTINADRVQVQQVLMNLIMNAIDAMRGVWIGRGC